MTSSNLKIGIIGAGRLGTSFAATTFVNGEVVAISTRSTEKREWLSALHPEVAVLQDAVDVASVADLVFITSNDAAIAPICDSIDWHSDHYVVHCSGVFSLDVLASAKNAGASTAGFHPLQTFTKYNDPDRLKNIAYAIDCKDVNLREWLWRQAIACASRPFQITGQVAHNAYHASAVLACGLLAGLVGISAELWKHAGIDRDEAIRLLTPMLHSTIDAIADEGLPEAMSGPFVRGDQETIRIHLDTTAELAQETSRAYASLALAQLHIAHEKGNYSSEALRNIEELLKQHLHSL